MGYIGLLFYLPKAIFYLLKGDYRFQGSGFRVQGEFQGFWVSRTLLGRDSGLGFVRIVLQIVHGCSLCTFPGAYAHTTRVPEEH